MILAITTNSGAGVDFVRMSATISEVAGSLPPVTRLTSMLFFATQSSTYRSARFFLSRASCVAARYDSSSTSDGRGGRPPRPRPPRGCGVEPPSAATDARDGVGISASSTACESSRVTIGWQCCAASATTTAHVCAIIAIHGQGQRATPGSRSRCHAKAKRFRSLNQRLRAAVKR